MMSSLHTKKFAKNRDGAMLPFVAVVIIILFIAAAFAIDIASIHVVRSELRTATDAAAKAGVEALGREQSEEAGIQAALRAAQANVVAGEGLTLERENIVFGTSGQNPDGTFFFDEGGAILNSVRVVGERTNTSPNGAVGLFFGPILGVTQFQPVQSATATRLDRDIALVLDVSGSMNQEGRFEALQNALDVFLSELSQTSQRENVSLTVYSTQERKIQDLTQDLQLISDGFAAQEAAGFTAIGLGLQNGLDAILNDAAARPFALKSIVIMTDGRQNTGISPDLIAPLCRDAGVTVHAVTFSRGANEDLMRSVADIAGGIHIHADTDEELLEAFQTIARQLQVLLIE